MTDRYRPIVDVHVILERDDDILLLERQGTGYGSGMLHLPSGHLEEGEPASHGAAREAHEETGVVIDPADLVLTTVVHHRQLPARARLGLFFATTHWSGDPHNAEPHKCRKLQWCDPQLLPSNTIPYPAAGIRAYLAGIPFTTHGWTP
ncbi:ADP-ribose pyrophosphatase YjhB (NUDIX family) [Actinomadura pelletieri DSM 43383]|uniref:ADP-ribose pyrophosphatase YjhB (NUDIX family) n=1 Tax=Actinomadura pelletieri DSM 43383 TaxID=1120940 RepID=A0A495QZL0_9ACTN|nr:NUDIX domain-containing protein [Actinomadura pelletieri]RKS79507.1 ADP-ribose pyrophosphatase YjhB (NUDIX family) [Actinomadura pelletieri DSM 43383]